MLTVKFFYLSLGLSGNNMHRFNLVAAQVLLGLESVDGTTESHCFSIIKNCYQINHSVPTHTEFAEAFNQLLYVSAIVIDSEKVTLTNFGRDLINNARSKASTEIQLEELLELVHKELSGYKLKSMCNRTVWTEAQYQKAVAAIANI